MDKNLDMAKQRSTPPTIIRKSDTAAEAPRPTKRTNGDDVGFAGCWQDIGTYGNDDLWGTYQVDWCGDGSWITYNTQSCWGGEDNTPTYQYLGCSVSPRYGVGWNVLDVRHEFDLCYVYNPLWGTCSLTTVHGTGTATERTAASRGLPASGKELALANQAN